MANLKVLHVDLDTGALIAKSGTVGSDGTGGNYVSITGSSMTGPLYLSEDPEVDAQAATKRYVDSTITQLQDSIRTMSENVSNGLQQKLNISGGTLTGHIKLVDDPVEPLNPATKQYVDAEISNRSILRIGGTMIGPLQLSGPPQLDSHAATKAYVDTQINTLSSDGAYLSIGGGTVTGPITLDDDPSEPMHAATKQYVDDNKSAGLSFKEPVRATTTEHLVSLRGLPQIDGVQLQSGDRVLVKSQDDPVRNGIYNVGTGLWSRADDAIDDQMRAGAVVTVTEGDSYGDTGWVLASDGTILIGTSPLSFVLFSSSHTDDTYVNLTGDRMVGSLYLLGEPTTTNEAANKGYIDRVITERGYKYTNNVPSSTWTIQHNRNTTNLMVQVFDENNEMVIPSRIHRSPDYVTVEFGASEATGSAVIIFL